MYFYGDFVFKFRKMRRLISICTICKYVSHFSLGISKSHSLTILKLEGLYHSVVGGGLFYPILNGLRGHGRNCDFSPIASYYCFQSYRWTYI